METGGEHGVAELAERAGLGRRRDQAEAADVGGVIRARRVAAWRRVLAEATGQEAERGAIGVGALAHAGARLETGAAAFQPRFAAVDAAGALAMGTMHGTSRMVRGDT